MNAIPPPPTTALTDVMLLFAGSSIIAAIAHLIRGRDSVLRQEAEAMAKRVPDPGSITSVSEDQLTSIRRFHKSLVAFTLSWLPFLVLAAGNTCCSLSRDAGYLIIPWPLVSVGAAFGVTLAVTQSIRERCIRHCLQRPNQHLQPPPR